MTQLEVFRNLTIQEMEEAEDTICTHEFEYHMVAVTALFDLWRARARKNHYEKNPF